MSYSFSDQLNKLSSLLGDPNSGSSDMFPASQRYKEINRGEINLAVDSKDLMAYATGTVSGTSITLPTDYLELHLLVVNSVVLTNDFEHTIEDYERFTVSGDMPDAGYYYWPDASGNELLNLVGTSSAGETYKLYYFKKPTTELSGLTDNSIHREEFREGSVLYAASELMLQIGKSAQANDFRMRYEAMVQKADAWARKRYITKNYARPDFGNASQSSTDRQGRSH